MRLARIRARPVAIVAHLVPRRTSPPKNIRYLLVETRSEPASLHPVGHAKPPGKSRNANRRPIKLLDDSMGHWAFCGASCCTVISGQPACPNCPGDAGLHRPG